MKDTDKCFLHDNPLSLYTWQKAFLSDSLLASSTTLKEELKETGRGTGINQEKDSAKLLKKFVTTQISCPVFLFCHDCEPGNLTVTN